jgi:hypothetical protein
MVNPISELIRRGGFLNPPPQKSLYQKFNGFEKNYQGRFRGARKRHGTWINADRTDFFRF